MIFEQIVTSKFNDLVKLWFFSFMDIGWVGRFSFPLCAS